MFRKISVVIKIKDQRVQRSLAVSVDAAVGWKCVSQSGSLKSPTHGHGEHYEGRPTSEHGELGSRTLGASPIHRALDLLVFYFYASH